MSDSLREYRRELALHCMSRKGEAITSGDLVDEMGVLSQSELHPRACWGGIDARDVAGILKTLATQGLVVRADELQHNPRHGRQEPMWRLTSLDQVYALPTAPPTRGSDPLQGATAAVTANAPYDGMSKRQLYTLLRFQDEQAGSMARFIRDIAEINERFRHALAEVGLDIPG